MQEASSYTKAEEGKVRCSPCAHHCLINPGGVGICGVRRNDGGTLFSLVYGRAIAGHVDSIEKKPLFHFLPGSTRLGLAVTANRLRAGGCPDWGAGIAGVWS